MSCTKDQGKIIGTASADGGNILSGITVKLYDDGTGLQSTTTTDNTGSFTFSDLEAGNYYIGATIISGTDTFDTGNRPQIVYVGDEIEKEVTLNLSLK
jgi:hypothetical protein